MRKHLTQEQKAYISQYYVELGPERFCEVYNEMFGTNHGVVWAKNAAKRLGVSIRDSPPGWYSVSEISYLFGVAEQTVQGRIRSGAIAGKRFGKRKYFIHEDEIPKIQAWYAASKQKLPWPAVSSQQAADTLGMSIQAVVQVIKRGHIDAIKCGKNYMVRKEHIEWGLKQMKLHGFTKIPWYKMRERIKG